MASCHQDPCPCCLAEAQHLDSSTNKERPVPLFPKGTHKFCRCPDWTGPSWSPSASGTCCARRPEPPASSFLFDPMWVGDFSCLTRLTWVCFVRPRLPADPAGWWAPEGRPCGGEQMAKFLEPIRSIAFILQNCFRDWLSKSLFPWWREENGMHSPNGALMAF